MEHTSNPQEHNLGVNNSSKNIKKTPYPSKTKVYTISKNDFRTVVQQLTGASTPTARLHSKRPPLLAPVPRHAPPVPAESPVTAYVRHLKASLLSSDPSRRSPHFSASSSTPFSPLLPSPTAFLNLISP